MVNFLQFVDTKLFLYEVNAYNAIIIKNIIRCYPLSCHLRVNLCKIRIECIGINELNLERCLTTILY